jgi:hypothetical protein
LLGRLIATQQQQINDLTTPGKIKAIAGAVMNGHLGHTLPNRFTITEIALFGASNP